MAQSICSFPILSKKLNDLGYPEVNSSTFQIIKDIDFGRAIQDDKIDFKEDGIYYNIDGKWYRGYVFIKQPYIEKYGNYPKFHIRKCSTLLSYINDGRFKQRYDWSNSSVNDLIDKTEGTKFKDNDLSYCNYCNKLFDDDFRLTSEFYERLDKSDVKQKKIENTFFGDVVNIVKVHKLFLESKKYTCENCNIRSKSIMHNRFWYCYHLDGNLENTSTSNLSCLCISCYSKLDASKFSSDAKKSQLKSYEEDYQVD